MPDIPDDLAPYVLAPFFIIHEPSLMKIVFLKDNCFFLKGQELFHSFAIPDERSDLCVNDKYVMLYSVRYVNFRANMPARVITQKVATLKP